MLQDNGLKAKSDFGILLDRNRILSWYIKSIDIILEVIIYGVVIKRWQKG
jgi:hypothetical protein